MKKISIASFFALLCLYTSAQTTVLNPMTDKNLLEDFQKRKLGLFVHWMACFSPKTGDSWGIGRGTSKEVADSITLAWNPKKFSAKEIVDFAVKSGCKYMVVISKHHDGFSIWDSKFTDFDLQAIKFKKDILKELKTEAKRRGIMFGIYYSIADLHYTGWEKMPELNNVPPEPNGGKEKMIEFVNNQVKELITDYDPEILWFDGYWLDKYWTEEDGKNLYNFIKKTKPSILATRTSLTIGADGVETFKPDGSAGDFYSWEAKERLNAPAFPWEGCTSVSYPVYAYDPGAKIQSKKELINIFDKTICANGNFLLNIGPKRDGSLPKKLTSRFLELSEWVLKNKDAVYNTTAGPFKQGDWGGSTYKENKIYLHLRRQITPFEINVPNGYKLLSAKEIVSGKPLAVKKSSNGYIINTPMVNAAGGATIIELRLDKNFVFSDWLDLPIK